LPREIAESCKSLTKSFGLNFSAIDMVFTPNDEYVFLELNPQGRWLWLEKLTGIGVTSSLAKKLYNLSKDCSF